MEQTQLRAATRATAFVLFRLSLSLALSACVLGFASDALRKEEPLVLNSVGVHVSFSSSLLSSP